MIFVLAFMVLWPFARHRNGARWATLTAFSLVFYGWWDVRFLVLLLGSGAIDFFACMGMEKFPRMRRSFLVLSIVVNIGSLCFFKYLGFAVDQLSVLLEIPPRVESWSSSIILPIGISFYTFQSMSYTIDVFRGKLRAVSNPLHFLSYLAMFPQLVAGPIVRATELLPQLETKGRFSAANRLAGVRLATWGFVKKLVIADNLAPVVNELFASAAIEDSMGLAWLAAVLFAIQIFADFSGYSDIACGIAKWMGYEFPQNFRQPYAACGFRDFWTRWHITLSTWFRDYVYIPLGGSRRSSLRSNWNLLFTMIVSGLWHGANWTFIFWGVLHGVLLLSERIVNRIPGSDHIPSVVWWGITMWGVLTGWVIFRAETPSQAIAVGLAMYTGGFDLSQLLSVITPAAWMALVVASSASIVWAIGRRKELGLVASMPSLVQATIVAAGIFLAIFLRGSGNAFIYFQF